jgi:hypothetical protein
MPQPGAHREPAAAPALRCMRCGASVHETRHTRTDYQVGYYRLHGGRTVEATVRLEDEVTFTYRRLVEPAEFISCPACMTEPAVRDVWDRFGEAEEAPAG